MLRSVRQRRLAHAPAENVPRPDVAVQILFHSTNWWVPATDSRRSSPVADDFVAVGEKFAGG